MCLPISEKGMLDWLKSQVRMIEAWRERLACQPEFDVATLSRVEQHYQWLTAEVTRLEGVGA